MQRSTHR